MRQRFRFSSFAVLARSLQRHAMTVSRNVRLIFLAGALITGNACALTPVRVAQDVYAFIGTGGVVNAQNRGFVANTGFIVGPTGVVVIDTGVSYRYGRLMLDAIRRITDRPVELVVLTHAVQEVVFGAAAFEEAGATLAAHRETIELMKARCAHCLETLRALLGRDLDGTRLVLPTRVIEASTRIRAGGVGLELVHSGWGSTPGDLAVFHAESGTLFSGGLISVNQVPAIRDCDFAGWRSALHQLESLNAARIVPVYGPVSGTEAIGVMDQYLAALDVQVRSFYAESSSLIDALERADLAHYRGWSAYEPQHRQNVLHRYLQLEVEDLGGDPRSIALPQR